MTVASADGRYGYRPWDRPAWEPRPGDQVDPSPVLNVADVITEFETINPVPVSAGYQPRLIGAERTQPGVIDVLSIGADTLMRDQDAGIQGTARPSNSNLY